MLMALSSICKNQYFIIMIVMVIYTGKRQKNVSCGKFLFEDQEVVINESLPKI